MAVPMLSRHSYCYRGGQVVRGRGASHGQARGVFVILRIGLSAPGPTKRRMVELCFHGAAGTVTGSCIEVALDADRRSALLADLQKAIADAATEGATHGASTTSDRAARPIPGEARSQSPYRPPAEEIP